MIYSIISIILIIASLLLVTFNVLKSKWYAWLIYFVGLFTAYGTTMVGMSVVGSDISRELLMSNLALQNWWDLSLYDPSNTSWVVGWFVPSMAQIFDVGAEWIYKIVIPMIFALTPVILYFIFRKQFGELKAIYASMFFIIVPVFALEVCTIAKSMVAEAFMVWVIWLTMKEETVWFKTTAITVLTILTLWAHYTIGILLCIYLGGMWVFNMVQVFVKKKETDHAIKIVPLIVPLIFGVLFTYLYYSNVAQGLIWNSVSGIFSYDFSQSLNIINKSVNPSIVVSDNVSSTVKAYSLVSSAFGMDLLNHTWSGIAFRIVQLLTQILIVIGFVWMLIKHKFYNLRAEYVAGCFVAFGLLGLCVFVPAFASLINVTRQYHISLMFLAPCLVVAFDMINRRDKCVQ